MAVQQAREPYCDDPARVVEFLEANRIHCTRHSCRISDADRLKAFGQLHTIIDAMTRNDLVQLCQLLVARIRLERHEMEEQAAVMTQKALPPQ